MLNTTTRSTTRFFVAAAALSLVACVSMPEGPSVMVLPGSGKNFDQFRADDFECKHYASQQIGGGAAVGAGAGMALGGLSGTGTAQTSAYGVQQRYDVAFMQCMYAKGHRIPAGGRFTSEQMFMPRDTFPSYPPPPAR